MKYNKIFLFLFLSAFLTNTSFGDVYSWKDENGVMHFTDTPPPDKTVKDEQLNIMKTAKKTFYHKYYKKEGEDEYCGSQRMSTYDDPRTGLINAYYQAASGYEGKRFFRKDYSRLLSGEDQIYARSKKTIKFGGRNTLEKKMGECDCRIEWTENKIAELKPYVDIILKEAEITKQEYNDSIPDCGEKPPTGRHTEQERKDWFNCMFNRNQEAEQRKKRKLSRNATSTKKSLLSAIKRYNKAK